MNGARFSVGAILTGLMFVVVGALCTVSAYVGWEISSGVLWPSLLIGAGVVVVAGGMSGVRGDR